MFRYVQMALKLLYERRLGPESKLAPYVAALPAEFSTPLSWTEAQLQALRYPYLLQEVLRAPLMTAGLGPAEIILLVTIGCTFQLKSTCDAQVHCTDVESYAVHFSGS